MRGRISIPAALALAAMAALLGACKATDTAGNVSASPLKAGEKPSAGTTEVQSDGVRRVKHDELKAMLADGGAVVYDTRTKAAYDAEHIKGALSMPHDEVAGRAGELPKDKTLVFYCT